MSAKSHEHENPPQMRWVFARPGKGQRQRNSKLDDHFAGSGSDRAGDLGREGTQNASDAGLAPVSPPVRIRIGFGHLNDAQAARYGAGLIDHVPDISKQKGMSRVALIAGDGACNYLTFEDFNTTGLTGDPKVERRYDGDPVNHFHTFFRAEGQTDKDKDNDKKQGSHGIGKVAFMAASNARAVLGLTCRHDDQKELLFGTAVLHTHRCGELDYDGDAWYGVPAGDGVEPAEDAQTLARFRSDFNLARKPGEPGFSVVVPWLNWEEVQAEMVIDAVLRGHVLPIMEGQLVIEISNGSELPDTTIDAAHFLPILETRKDQTLKAQVRPVAELAAWALANAPSPVATLALHPAGAPRWTATNLMSAQQRDEFRSAFDSGKPLSIRVPVRVKPKTSDELTSYFDVFIRREIDTASVPGPTVQFVRQGLLITGMGKRIAGVRGLVVIEEDALAEMLKASENPSHTRWNAKAIKETYHLHTSTVSFVTDSVRELVKLLAGDPTEKDASIWANEMSVSAGDVKGIGSDGDGDGDGERSGGTEKDGKKKKPIITIKPPAPKRPYSIVPNIGGFVISPSGKPFGREPTMDKPATLELQLAYFVRGKSPLSQWNSNDFDLANQSKIDLQAVRGCNIETRKGKLLVLKINNPDFEFAAGGFDKFRELFCQPRFENAVPDIEIDEEIEPVPTTVAGGAE